MLHGEILPFAVFLATLTKMILGNYVPRFSVQHVHLAVLASDLPIQQFNRSCYRLRRNRCLVIRNESMATHHHSRRRLCHRCLYAVLPCAHLP